MTPLEILEFYEGSIELEEGKEPCVIIHADDYAAVLTGFREVVEERDRLRDPWVHVGHLTSLGVSFHAGAEFPGEGETVLVAVHDVTGERHQIHTHTNERGRWHWPSFGVAWMRIPALTERSKP